MSRTSTNGGLEYIPIEVKNNNKSTILSTNIYKINKNYKFYFANLFEILIKVYINFENFIFV